MYHHANSDSCSNNLKILEEHFIYIKEHFMTVFPSEQVTKNSICLTFDDAYSDFYFLIYPLLKKYNLKALIAVPSAYILDTCNQNAQTRMSFSHDTLFENYQMGTFCTFSELKEMLDSGLIMIASHSHSHVNLTQKEVDLEQELKLSKQILETKLNIKVESFVFPFGKYDKKILEEAKKEYQYVFRIGNSIQKDFSGINGVIYRIDGDSLRTPNDIFTTKNMLLYRLKAFIKKVTNG